MSNRDNLQQYLMLIFFVAIYQERRGFILVNIRFNQGTNSEIGSISYINIQYQSLNSNQQSWE